jgi:hypothetical protein
MPASSSHSARSPQSPRKAQPHMVSRPGGGPLGPFEGLLVGVLALTAVEGGGGGQHGGRIGAVQERHRAR